MSQPGFWSWSRWKLFYSWGVRPALSPPWERDWLDPEAKEAEGTEPGSEQWTQSLNRGEPGDPAASSSPTPCPRHHAWSRD